MRYRVWTIATKPENGAVVEAVTGWEARKVCFDAWRRTMPGLEITDVMARRDRPAQKEQPR